MRKLLFAFLLFAFPLFAQTTTTTPPATTTTSSTTLPGWAVQVSAGYSYITNANENNGFFSSIDVPLYHDKSNNFSISGSGSYFSITTPSSYFVGAGPVLHGAWSSPNLLNGQVFEPFAGLDFGVTRSVDSSTGTPTGATKFGFGVKGGLDTILKGNVVWRIFQVEFIHSTLYPGNSVTVSNIGQISTGIGFRF